MLLRPDSPLRNLPAALDRKQALFLNGLRQNAEIALFAYERLCGALSRLALQECSSDEQYLLQTSAFADAWAVVDAIDRYRSLRHLLPKAVYPQAADGRVGFRHKTRAIRGLRDVNDHLADRADMVVASATPSLGALTWMTVKTLDPIVVLSCLLAPGSLTRHRAPVVNPLQRRVWEVPTDIVWLEAGQWRADLSQALRDLREVVEDLEQALTKGLAMYPGHEPAATDLLAIVTLKAND